MKVAVIGGIGTGKSEVLKVAREMGIACLSADEINAELLRDPQYVAKLSERFPECVVCGVVDKPRLSALVFSDKESRLALNAIAHPEIKKRIEGNAADPLVVELPLVYESGMRDAFDEIVLVTAPRRVRAHSYAHHRQFGGHRRAARSRAHAATYIMRMTKSALYVINTGGKL